MENKIDKAVTFYKLHWDTEFFGVKSAKAILHKALTIKQWNELKSLFLDYQFVSIENCNSEPANAQLIGKETNAFLADVNIQFRKQLDGAVKKSERITIEHSLKKDDRILEIANFKYSKFSEDPELAKRGGEKVYYQWVLNSFEKPNKAFALSRDKNDNINGFMLHSYNKETCRVELIALAKKVTSCGIGTRLFEAVEHSAFEKGYRIVNVGTQLRNTGAINFYHKMGYKQVGCHQVYHLWASI